MSNNLDRKMARAQDRQSDRKWRLDRERICSAARLHPASSAPFPKHRLRKSPIQITSKYIFMLLTKLWAGEKVK